MFAGIVRLVPYSGVQFCDVTVPRAAGDGIKTLFTEEPLDVDGVPTRVLLPLETATDVAAATRVTAPADVDATAATIDPARESVPPQRPRIMHPVTGKAVDPARLLELNGAQTIARFAGHWIPLPYLRFIGRDEHQRPRYDGGPTNWVRLYITPSEQQADAPIRMTLAFDTNLDLSSRFDTSAYAAPNVDDAAFGSTFVCVEHVDDMGALLGEPWLDAWLKGLLAASAVDPAPGAAEPAAGNDFEHQHLAYYLTLLRVLATAGVLPEARFTDTIQRRFPIRMSAVDLVIDVGDTETTALLVDVSNTTNGDASGAFAEQLRLRDLSEPAVVHDGSFPTLVEFDSPPFGDHAASRDSGRNTAFQWPSLVRIGREARRLSLRGNGTEGVTGLSNLRSFLLDETANPGLWRQSTDDRAVVEHGPMVSGLTLAHMGENGQLIGAEPPDPLRPLITSQRPAIRPRFSRASMLAFFATELALHAVSQVNAASRDGSGVPEGDVRELRRVIVLAPPALDHVERTALLARIDAGFVLAWRGLGWDKATSAGIPKRPMVSLGLGGDLGTQIAFLHDEVTAKYQGRFEDLLRVYRGGDGGNAAADALRVASVEFGARTTSLTIVDYAASHDTLLAAEWEPRVIVSERLPVGTDAALQALIWTVLLPSIEAQLGACGLNPARHFLDEITGRSTTSLLVEDPYFTRRLNRKVLWPAARALFAIDAQAAASATHGNRAVSLATLVTLGGGRLEPTAAAFDAAARQVGARGFTLGDTPVALQRGALGKLIALEMNDTIAQISRATAAHECDLLLIGGDGSRLPSLTEAVLAAMPLPASRMINLATHINRTAADAFGARQQPLNPSALAAVAAALERRNALDASGFGARALRLLEHGTTADTQDTALEADARRALAAPAARDGGGRPGNDRPDNERSATGTNGLPARPATGGSL